MRNLVDYLFHCKSLITNKSIDTIIDFIATQND